MLTHVPVKLVKGYQHYQIHTSATIVVSPLLPFDLFGKELISNSSTILSQI
jgi:hypothetical protein